MTIKVGDKLPAATFKVKTADGVKEVTTDEVFAGKRSFCSRFPVLSHRPAASTTCRAILKIAIPSSRRASIRSQSLQ